MLVSYIHEVAGDVNEMCMGQIDTEYWTVMFTKGSNPLLKWRFDLPDKHLFSTICLEHILDIINISKSNDAAEKEELQ